MQSECAGRKLGLFGIAPDVSRDVHEMVPAANHAIKVILLPESPRGVIPPVYLDRGEAFPRGDNAFDGYGFAQGKKQMHVIGHDDPSMQQVAAVVEMLERLHHDAGVGGLPEQACAMTLVEIPIHGGGKMDT